MKKKYYLILIIIFLCNSCGYDKDDRIPRVDDGSVFVSEDGEVYATGMTCLGTGDYVFDSANVLQNLVIPPTLPNSFDLSGFLPPIGNQGTQPSCVSWAVTYYMKSLQERINATLPYDEVTIMSPAYTYNQISMGNCTGTSIEQTLDVLKNSGACSFADFLYNESNCSLQPSTSINQLAETNKISDYKYLSGNNMVSEMKALLTQQTPIIIGAYLTKKFGKVDSFGVHAYREHAVEYGTGACHAMLVVGYSDAYNAFKVVNSWGSGWGDGGFVWIDYKAFDNVSVSGASFRVINQAIIAYDL